MKEWLKYLNLVFCLGTTRSLSGTRALFLLLCCFVVGLGFFQLASGNISISFFSVFPMEEKRKKILYLLLYFPFYGENCCNVLAMSLQTKTLPPFGTLIVSFRCFLFFYNKNDLDVFLIPVQSCFLLAPPGLQLCHCVDPKVTVCLG